MTLLFLWLWPLTEANSLVICINNDLWKRLITLLFVWIWPLKEANHLVICMIITPERGSLARYLNDYDLWKGSLACYLYDYDLWKRPTSLFLYDYDLWKRPTSLLFVCFERVLWTELWQCLADDILLSSSLDSETIKKKFFSI